MYKCLRLVKNGKKPFTAGAFNGEDDNVVRQHVKSGGNYGILTGKINNVAVIDIDNHHGVDGSVNLESFCEMYDIDLPDTLSVETPSGGVHLYFELPSEFDETQFIQNHPQLEGVDFQTHGRFVVGWGSKIDGNEYKKLNNLEPAQLPRLWLELFTDKTIQKGNKKRERKWTANFLGEIIAGCPTGGRNIFMARMIGNLFATGLNDDEIKVWCGYINQISFDEPLSDEEVEITFNSIKRREERRRSE